MHSRQRPVSSPDSPSQNDSIENRKRHRSLDRESLSRLQLTRLNQVLTSVSDHPLYRDTIARLSLPATSIDQIQAFDFVTKSDLVPDRPQDPSRLFVQPLGSYTRLHQTSGSRGFPMPVYDTPKDWEWWMHCWQHVLDAANVTSSDVAMMAFSFGPFIGFWSANDALVQRGALVVAGGGMSSLGRLQMIDRYRCTILCCTPTYAMHLANVAREQNLDLAAGSVERIIVAGEPGGSVASTRANIESAWGAQLIDHAGASELGAWGVGTADGVGLHVIETDFLAEFLVFEEDGSARSAHEGEACELVLTNLGRLGGPLIRYRTGDIVRPVWDHELECRFVKLDGGVIGRSDDMVIIRGVNIFPSSIEAIVREVAPYAEFRVTATRAKAMDQLAVDIETSTNEAIDVTSRLADCFQERLAVRIAVQAVPENSLPRFEAKAKRFVDQRM